MAFGSFDWETVGPRREERLLAGKVAGALWLTVLPMVLLSLFLPGSPAGRLELMIAMVLPALVWGLLCLFYINWGDVSTPLFFHVPATLALPFIATLIALTGGQHSPFDFTLLMLVAFCSYFFSPLAAVFYLVSSLVVLGFPLIYVDDALGSELPSRVLVATFVFAAVGGVIMVGKHQLLALRDEAQELSLRDSLTGLANRRALTDLLASIEGGTRQSDSVGLLLIDIDDFKEANTRHGLPAGDRVLVAVADALRALSREDDMVVRLGGDEFAIVCRQLEQAGMRTLAERALRRIQRACDGLELPGLEMTASASWAIFPEDAESIHQLVTVADLALRAAKAEGKNRFHAPIRGLPELVAQ